MFRKLDAEFACIIYDAETKNLIAARDPIGIRPLFYGYPKEGEIIFASEAKNLVGIVDKIDENNRFSFNSIRLSFILELAEIISLSLLLST